MKNDKIAMTITTLALSFCFLAAGSLDPFRSGSVPTSLETVSWSKLSNNASKYAGKVISIHGCLLCREKNGQFFFRLFQDREAYLLNKPLTFLDMPSADLFCNAIDKDDPKWKLLDGKDVECWGEFITTPEDVQNERLGSLALPYRLKTISAHGVDAIFEDSSSKWK